MSIFNRKCSCMWRWTIHIIKDSQKYLINSSQLCWKCTGLAIRILGSLLVCSWYTMILENSLNIFVPPFVLLLSRWNEIHLSATKIGYILESSNLPEESNWKCAKHTSCVYFPTLASLKEWKNDNAFLPYV